MQQMQQYYVSRPMDYALGILYLSTMRWCTDSVATRSLVDIAISLITTNSYTLEIGYDSILTVQQ